jgi:hypothetical protein
VGVCVSIGPRCRLFEEHALGVQTSEDKVELGLGFDHRQILFVCEILLRICARGGGINRSRFSDSISLLEGIRLSHVFTSIVS